MNRQELKAFAKEAAKSIKTSDDLNQFSQMLKKITIEAAFNAEMDEHLGYQKHHISTSSNSRNGKSSKRIKTEDGEFELATPRHRNGFFQPELVKKMSNTAAQVVSPVWMIKFFGCTLTPYVRLVVASLASQH